MATLTTKRIAVSSFNVLECEIPIKWAQTNWFVSDFYNSAPHASVRISFFLSVVFARFLSYFIQLAHTNAHSLHTPYLYTYSFFFFCFVFRYGFVGAAAAGFVLLSSVVFVPSLTLSRQLHAAMRPFSLFARYIFHIDSKEDEENEKSSKTHTHKSDNGVYCFVGYLMQTRYTIEKLNTLKTFSSVSVIIAYQPANQPTKQQTKQRKSVKLWTKEEPEIGWARSTNGRRGAEAKHILTVR